MKRDAVSEQMSSWLRLVCPLAGSLVVAGCGDVNDLIDAVKQQHHHGGGGGPECPNICEAICAGEPEPPLPPACPIPACACD
jgi:hypothetical protein